MLKSNSGPSECCYGYCGSIPRSGVCARCDPLLDDEDDGTEHGQMDADAKSDSPTSGKKAAANSTNAISSSSSSGFTSIDDGSSSSSRKRNLLEELRFSSELPPRLATCPSITSATTPSSPSEHCRSAQQLLLQSQTQQQQLPSNPDTVVTLPSAAPSSASTAPAVTATTTAASSSASSLASSSSFIKLTSIKSIYKDYFNNSWTMRLRCLDEFVAWTKILLQLAGL